jgi:proteasome accessory factor C
VTTLAAAERMQRLLAIVPWIAARDGPRISEVCERFDVDEQQLLADLDVIWMVGLPPYTPEQLIDVVVEDGRVWIHYAEYFARPLRLTPQQGLALVAAGQALLALPGADETGPLARGLKKLADALQIRPGEALTVDLGDASSDVVAVLQEAVAARRRVTLDYYSYGRDELTHRTVDPYRLHADEGALYVFAHCHLAGGERLFRIDRIRRVTLLDETFELPEDARRDETLFRPSADDPRVTLEVDASASWVAEAYPVEDVRQMRSKKLRVTLAVAARPWLERLLLRLGGAARVVKASDTSLVDAASEAAARILVRYDQR